MLNNPLLYIDPSGEEIGLFGSMLIGAAVAIVSTVVMNAINDVPVWYGLGKATVFGAAAGASSYGIGAAVKAASLDFVVQAGMHGASAGQMSLLSGDGNFWSSFASGAISSLVSSGIGSLGPQGTGSLNSGTTQALMIVGGGLSGGISSSIAGGDFGQGMLQGLITSGLNHLAHYVRDDLWQIKNGKATLMDESSNGIYIESNGSIFQLSAYDFTNNMSAAEDIVNYYAKDNTLSAYNRGEFKFSGGNFSSRSAANRAGFKGTLMAVNLKSKGWWFYERLESNARFYLIGNKFTALLNNKFNMINAIGHEYSHHLDNIKLRTLYSYGFDYGKISGVSETQSELRAIQYQKSLPSWEFTTPEFQLNIKEYESTYK